MNYSERNTPETKIIVIVGPTASGKTELAVKIALHMNCEIISADSRQIYKGLDKGTGKPTPEQGEKAKHYLISEIEPVKTVTAEDFANLADIALQTIKASGKNCIVVGGTGLWIRSFLDGLAPVPPADPGLRERLHKKAELEGNISLFQQLEKADPETAVKLHPSDRSRIIRALEILLLTGEKPSERRRRKSLRVPLNACWFGLTRPREELYHKAEKRIADWIKRGWREEVLDLLKQGVPAEAPALQAIGYSHLVKHLQGEYSLERAVELIKRDTRRYIKRQMTWFRAEKRITWLEPEQPIEDILNIIQAAIPTFCDK